MVGQAKVLAGEEVYVIEMSFVNSYLVDNSCVKCYYTGREVWEPTFDDALFLQ